MEDAADLLIENLYYAMVANAPQTARSRSSRRTTLPHRAS